MNTTSKNVIWLLMSQVFTWSLTVVVLAIVPDRFGPDGFGDVQLATVYVSFFILLGLLGSAGLLTRTVARDHSQFGTYVKTAFVMKSVMWAGLSVIAYLGTVLLGYSPSVRFLVVIALIAAFFGVLNETLVGALAGMQRMRWSATWLVVQTYIAGLGGLIVAVWTGSLSLFMWIQAISVLVALVANYFYARRFIGPKARVDRSVFKILIVGGLPLMVLNALNTVYGTIDIPILKSLTDSETVGWYALAYRWVGIPVFIASVVVTAFLPSLSSMAHDRPDEFRRLSNIALKAVVLVSIPASVGIALEAEDLLTMLYGHQYDNSVVLIRILAFHIPLAAVGTVLATVLIASDRQNRYVFVALAAVVINIPLNVILINATADHFDNGAIGAAIATTATELIVMLGALRLRSAGVAGAEFFSFAGRCVVASAVMAVGVLAIDSLGPFVRIPVGAALFAVMAVALGVLPRHRLRSTLDQFVAPFAARRSAGHVPEPG
jgi:O-antigen/teichoic acid export membrane protein